MICFKYLFYYKWVAMFLMKAFSTVHQFRVLSRKDFPISIEILNTLISFCQLLTQISRAWRMLSTRPCKEAKIEILWGKLQSKQQWLTVRLLNKESWQNLPMDKFSIWPQEQGHTYFKIKCNFTRICMEWAWLASFPKTDMNG